MAFAQSLEASLALVINHAAAAANPAIIPSPLLTKPKVIGYKPVLPHLFGLMAPLTKLLSPSLTFAVWSYNRHRDPADVQEDLSKLYDTRPSTKVYININLRSTILLGGLQI